MTDATPFEKLKSHNALGVLDEFDKANVPAFAAPLHDMHCHVGFMDDPVSFVHNAQNARAHILSVGVDPFEYSCLLRHECFREKDSYVHIALGLHPWWVPDDGAALRIMLDEFDAQIYSSPYIGEVGLDFSSRRAGTKDLQLQAFDHIAEACASYGNKVLSIHCIRAHSELVSLLSKHDVNKNCACIFHWFSGSSDDLKWARDAGCYFSINKRMLTTKRGREYVKAIPEDALLLETDAPPEPSTPYAFTQIENELFEVLQNIAHLRKREVNYLSGVINKNVNNLLSLKDFMD